MTAIAPQEGGLRAACRVERGRHCHVPPLQGCGTLVALSRAQCHGIQLALGWHWHSAVRTDSDRSLRKLATERFGDRSGMPAHLPADIVQVILVW